MGMEDPERKKRANYRMILPMMAWTGMDTPNRSVERKKRYEFNVGPETGQKLHSVFLHTSIVIIQADRACGTGISPRSFVISFVILYVCNIVQYWYLTICHYVSS